MRTTRAAIFVALVSLGGAVAAQPGAPTQPQPPPPQGSRLHVARSVSPKAPANAPGLGCRCHRARAGRQRDHQAPRSVSEGDGRAQGRRVGVRDVHARGQGARRAGAQHRAQRVRQSHARAREPLLRAHREDRGRSHEASRRHDRAAREVPAEPPDRAQETPDAMFRLADLYLDQANEEVDAAARRDRKRAGSAAPNRGLSVDRRRLLEVARAVGRHPAQVPELSPDGVDAVLARVLRQDEGRAPVARDLPGARVLEQVQVGRQAAARCRRTKRRSSASSPSSCAIRTPTARRIRAPTPSWFATRGFAASPTTTSSCPASSTKRSPRISKSPTAATTAGSTPSRSTSSRGATTSATC